MSQNNPGEAGSVSNNVRVADGFWYGKQLEFANNQGYRSTCFYLFKLGVDTVYQTCLLTDVQDSLTY